MPPLDADEFRREKEKARALRDSAWWKKKRGAGICHYCRRRFPPAQLTMDHVIPLARGGRSTKENLVPSCKECNNQKKSMIPAEWTGYLESLRNRESKQGSAPGPDPNKKPPET
ncbi:MAG: HNH endonuclease [Spirochaetia bacterium]|nr:HNH endonuclease [Spirochaetia bacterium]